MISETYRQQLQHVTRKRDMPRSVSYTHLDVYKRQASHKHFSFRGMLTASSSKVEVIVTFLAILEPVSYTHLDVYKRQEEKSISKRPMFLFALVYTAGTVSGMYGRGCLLYTSIVI